MKETVIYLKCKMDVETPEPEVYLEDVATLACSDTKILEKCKSIKVYSFEGEQKRVVVSSLRLIRLICSVCPEVFVQSVGESDVLIEKVKVDEKRGVKVWLKTLLVSLICFFGTSFLSNSFETSLVQEGVALRPLSAQTIIESLSALLSSKNALLSRSL